MGMAETVEAAHTYHDFDEFVPVHREARHTDVEDIVRLLEEHGERMRIAPDRALARHYVNRALNAARRRPDERAMVIEHPGDNQVDAFLHASRLHRMIVGTERYWQVSVLVGLGALDLLAKFTDSVYGEPVTCYFVPSLDGRRNPGRRARAWDKALREQEFLPFGHWYWAKNGEGE